MVCLLKKCDIRNQNKLTVELVNSNSRFLTAIPIIIKFKKRVLKQELLKKHAQ